jgi:hypothetical protein
MTYDLMHNIVKEGLISEMFYKIVLFGILKPLIVIFRFEINNEL